MSALDDETALRLHNDPHVLKIMIRSSSGEHFEPSQELHHLILKELQPRINDLLGPYLAIWTPDFFKKPFPLINYETAKPDGWAAGPSIALDQGRYLGSVALPAAFIEAKSNPRGRPGLRAGKVSESSNGTHVAVAGVREEIEYGVARALCIQAYRIVRFIAGAIEADHRELALGEAKATLLPHLAPLLPLTFHRPAEKTKDATDAGEKTDETSRATKGESMLSSLANDLVEAAPAHVAQIYGTTDVRQMGWAWAKDGETWAKIRKKRNPAVSPVDPWGLPLVQDMVAVFDALVQLRLGARWMADNIREQARASAAEDKRAKSDRARGYAIDSAVTQAIGSVRHPERMPSAILMLRMAYDLEFDASRVAPTHAYLRPLLEAAMALGAFERRGETARSALATYGLLAWSRRFYGLPLPVCEAALALVETVPAPMVPAADDRPRLDPIDVQLRDMKPS